MPSLTEGASRKDLPEAMRAKMENGFGADFSNLNIYESEKVAEGGAQAVTQGNTIAFAPGAFNPYSPHSEALLGHELSHVVSQARGESRGNGLLDNAYLEAKADREGVMAAAGQQVYNGPVTPLSNSSPMSVAGPMQCKKKKKPASSPFTDDLTPESETWANLEEASKNKDERAIGDAYEILSGRMDDEVRQASDLDDPNKNIKGFFADYIYDSSPYNKFLREGGNRDTEFGKKYGHRVDLMDKSLTPTGANVKTYRGVSNVALSHILQNSRDDKLKKAIKEDGSIDYTYLYKNRKLLKGLEFSEKGYTSTSVTESYADEWRQDLPEREVFFAACKQLRDNHLDSDMKDENSKIRKKMQYFEADKYENLSNKRQRLFNQFLAEEAYKDEYDAISKGLKNSYQGHMFEINVPKGAKAGMIDEMSVDGHFEHNNQKEMLLGRNTRFKITDMLPMYDKNDKKKKKKLKDQYRFLMEVVGQDD